VSLARSWIRQNSANPDLQNSANPDLKSGDFSYRGHEPSPHTARSWIRQNSANPDLKSGDFSYRGHESLPHAFERRARCMAVRGRLSILKVWPQSRMPSRGDGGRVKWNIGV
jgi:hypothetical protein